MVNGTLIPANRIYKARLFEMIFNDRAELLKLYNAVNKTNYDNPELLEINTLENAVYMSMHNDLSFIIGFWLSLYEHQSTYNPNLPLRFLMYVSDLYSKITKDMNLYSETRIKIPAPRFLIFYNGADEQPESQKLLLSQLYSVKEEDPSLELKAEMLNINPGYNRELLDTCKTLKDFSTYTARVREYTKEMALDEAVERAITECIEEGVLAEFLGKYRAEAKKVSIYEYDMEKHMRQEREEHLETGRKEGRTEKVVEQIQKKLAKGKSAAEIAEDLEEEREVIEGLMEKYIS